MAGIGAGGASNKAGSWAGPAGAVAGDATATAARTIYGTGSGKKQKACDDLLLWPKVDCPADRQGAKFFCVGQLRQKDVDVKAKRTSSLPLRRLASFESVIATLGGTARTAALLGISASYVSNWKRVNGKIPAKYYLVIGELLAEQGFVPANHVFSFAKRVRPKRRPVYCDFVESNVVSFDFRRRKTRLMAA